MDHADSTDNHRIERWTFPNATARSAMTGYPAPVAKDVAKVAYQQDNDTYWRLKNWSPVQWTAVMGALASGSISEGDLDFEILTPDDLAAHRAITPTQSENGHISWELLQDHLNGIISAAAPLVLTYNDGGNTFVFSVNTDQLKEIIDDRVAGLLVAGDGISLSYNDDAGSLRVTSTGGSSGGGGGGTGESVITSAGDLIRGGAGGPVRSDEFTNLAVPGTSVLISGGTGANPANAIDGNDATYAEITGMTPTAELKISFTANRNIASFRLKTNGSFPFTIESSTDNSNWEVRRRSYLSPADTGRVMLDASVNARYWRVKYFGAINPSGPWQVYAFELHTKPPVMPSNVGLASAGAVADAIDIAAFYRPASFINDTEDLGEKAETITNKGDGAWFSLELTQAYRIVAFRVVEEMFDDTDGDYKLQSSTNGTAWTDRYHVTTPEHGMIFLPTPTEAQFWRIIGDTDPDNDARWSVETFSVYAEPGAAPGDPERYAVGTEGYVLTVVDVDGILMPVWAPVSGAEYDLEGHIEGGTGISVAWDEGNERYAIFLNSGTVAAINAAVTPAQLATALAPYVTSSALATALGSYVSSASLASTLAGYVNTAALASALTPYVTSSGLTSALANYVTMAALASSLSGYATTTDLASHASTAPGSSTRGHPTTAEIDSRADARVAAGLVGYPNNSDLAAHAATAPGASTRGHPTNAEIDARADARIAAAGGSGGGTIASYGNGILPNYGNTFKFPGLGPISTGTRGYTGNTWWFQPWFVQSQITIDQMGVMPSTTLNANMAMAVYNADINWNPTSLISGSASWFANTNGQQIYTPSSPVVLAPGRYIAIMSVSATCTLKCWRTPMWFFGVDINTSNIPNQLYQTPAGVPSSWSSSLVGNGASNAQVANIPFDSFLFCRISAAS